MKLGLLAIGAVAALVAGLIVAAQVSAVSGTLAMGTGTAAPGGTVAVNLTSNVPAPGVGAFTVDITYDAAKVSIADTNGDGTVDSSDCSANGGVCNPNFGANVVRVTGASATGLRGAQVLGTVTFKCGAGEGSSPLTLAVNVFSDATIGAPAVITATPQNGSVTCAIAPTAVAAAATSTPVVLPPTGYGTTTGGSNGSLGWIIAALAGVGLAGIAGFGALRVRSRRS